MGKVIIVVDSEHFDHLSRLQEAAIQSRAAFIAESHDGQSYQILKNDASNSTGWADREGTINQLRQNL